MERWLALLAALVAALIGMLFFWLGGPTRSSTEVVQRVFVIEIRDHYFDPPGLTVQPHDRVVWVLKENAQGDGHTVTAYHPSYDRPLRIPPGARPWNSGVMTQLGQSYSYLFTLPGVYDYFCALHEQQGMVGRVIVGGTTNLPAVEQGLPATAQSSIPTIEELSGVTGEAFHAIALLQGIEYLAAQAQTALALRQLRDFQSVFSQSHLAMTLTQQGIREQFENRLSALEALLSRRVPISAIVQTVAQAEVLLSALARP
ncbi:MAG: plastocyanin/azurin family copper-binding protein [Candidatus Bipolaricaulota bacterium]|nr:plastocyanin/azurin family copper-binding protein [Candidatus Bipolaricaulota bacterium]MDW8030435.1 plastocyanin/azurin family copper-binding protein [Candidatus Bipolaricaulota bacterium]